MALGRVSALLVCIALGLTGVACAGVEEGSAGEVGTGEENFTVDIPKSEALLKKAVEGAEKRAASGACETDIFRTNIVDLLRQAVAVRDTVFFRTRVIAKKEILAKELAGTLEWQEILGTYNPAKPETLTAGLSAGVSLWDTNGGVFGNQQRIEFKAGGKAVIHTLDTEAIFANGPIHWDTEETTWRAENGKITLGNGRSWSTKHANGFLQLTAPGGDFPEFVSVQSECEA